MTKTCKNMNALGSCGLHNIHCGYPKCLTEEAMQPAVSKPAYVVVNGMHFTHSEILEWRDKEVAFRDRHPDDVAIDNFAQAMKNKMALKREKGARGWDNADECSVEDLAAMLVKHLSKGDPVDVANFAMMLFSRNAPDTVLKSAMLDAYVMYHQAIEQAQRIAKRAMGLVELPIMLVEIYIDMQHNGARYTADRKQSTEKRLLELLAYPEDTKKVSNEF